MRLILLRRHLLAAGRDLRIASLSGQPRAVYEIHLMADLLPCLEAEAAEDVPWTPPRELSLTR